MNARALVACLGLLGCNGERFGGPALCAPTGDPDTFTTLDATNAEDAASLLTCCVAGSGFGTTSALGWSRVEVRGTSAQGLCGFDLVFDIERSGVTRFTCTSVGSPTFDVDALVSSTHLAPGHFPDAHCERNEP